jgi:hypothetical protein
VALVVAVHLAARPMLAAAYDLGPLSKAIGEWQGQGRAIANFGKYHGQYQFLGRLQQPITPIGLKNGDEAAFLRDHGDGLIVSYHETVPKEARPLWVQPYRGKLITVWEASTVRKYPGIANRSSGRRR